MRGGKKEAKSVKGGDGDLFEDERGDVKKEGLRKSVEDDEK